MLGVCVTVKGLSFVLREATDLVQVGELVSIHSKDGNMDGQIGSSAIRVAVDAIEFRDRFGLKDELDKDDDTVVSVSAVVSFSTFTVSTTCFRSSGGLM
jgi:hypothetical protein